MEGCEGLAWSSRFGGGWTRPCRECPLHCTSDAWLMAQAVFCPARMRLCSWRPLPPPSDPILGSASAAFLSGRNWLRDRGSPQAEAILASPPQLEFVPLCSPSCYLGSGGSPSGAGGQWESSSHRVPSTFSPGSPILTGGRLGGDHKN